MAAGWWGIKNIGVPGAIGYGGYKLGKAEQARTNISSSTGSDDKKTTPKPKPKKAPSYDQAWSKMGETDKKKYGGSKQNFINQANKWWKTAEGQSYAKKHKQFSHRIKYN